LDWHWFCTPVQHHAFWGHGVQTALFTPRNPGLQKQKSEEVVLVEAVVAFPVHWTAPVPPGQ
jgi:hypothetical protein